MLGYCLVGRSARTIYLFNQTTIWLLDFPLCPFSYIPILCIVYIFLVVGCSYKLYAGPPTNASYRCGRKPLTRLCEEGSPISLLFFLYKISNGVEQPSQFSHTNPHLELFSHFSYQGNACFALNNGMGKTIGCVTTAQSYLMFH